MPVLRSPLGNRPIADIKPLELLDVLTRMEKRGATEKLKKVRQRCGEVWKYAIITGRAEYNPAPDLASAFIPHKREHYTHSLLISDLAFCGVLCFLGDGSLHQSQNLWRSKNNYFISVIIMFKNITF
ncbi:hypothetical protein TCT1_15270 [Xenorhabdus sp. TCT-1]|uniref:Phage integrase central domain-containing protein n=1 Tax=Xenorhabdus taiwanensis TaxID=3085177 RepID=A0ABM8JXA2_9GAMM|nr:hypothetical protein TCT1_15270 [Xenorhabdus sp. TCT-1]